MIGTQIGNYRIESKLGAGGMGVVYKAIHIVLDSPVAIKVLSPELARDPDLVERFQAEAKAQAKLNHANIAILHDFMNVQGNCLIVMEYVEGESFDQIIRRRGPVPQEEAVPLFKQALLGIGFAHRMGIIHRDIKPSNLMVNRHGIVKVMDFGIAKVLGGRRLTRTGMQVGTVFYMSPEQIRNQQVDIRSDIYSLGVTLYEMLTAHLPFESDSDFQVMADHVNTPPPLPTRHYPYISKGIEMAVLKALAKSPDARFQTVEEFGAAAEHPEGLAAVASQPASFAAAAGAGAGASAAEQYSSPLSTTPLPAQQPPASVQIPSDSERQLKFGGIGNRMRLWGSKRKVLGTLAGLGAMSMLLIALAIHFSQPVPPSIPKGQPPDHGPQGGAVVTAGGGSAGLGGAEVGSSRGKGDAAEGGGIGIAGGGSAGLGVARAGIAGSKSGSSERGRVGPKPKSILEIQTLINRRDYTAAIKEINGVIAAQPDNAAAHELLANALYYNRRYQEAESAARSVLDKDSTNQTALEVLAGVSFWTDASKGEWRQYAAKLSNSAPTTFWPLVSASLSELAAGHRDTAISDLESAKRVNPSDPAPHRVLAHIYLQSMELSLAKLQIDSALASFPDVTALLSDGVFLSLLTKNQGEAEQRLARLQNLSPNSKEALGAACTYYYGTDQPDAALKSCAQLIGIEDTSPTAHSNYGWALLDANQFPLACSEFLRAAELRKNGNSTPLDTVDLSWGVIICRYYSGDKKSAGDVFAKLNQNYPKLASVSGLQQLPLVWSRTTSQRMEEIVKAIGATAQLKSYTFMHRHVSMDGNFNVSRSYCTGTLTITPEGTVRFDCTDSGRNDPQGRCDHVAFPRGSIKEIKVNRDGSLHIATHGSGNYDFYGEAAAVQDSLRLITPFATRRK